MMMKIAGGPGLVSPLDYAERKKPLPKATWIAVSVVVLAHIGVGAALYYQKFEATKEAEVLKADSPFIVTITRPIPPKALPDPRPPAPNPPVHDTPIPKLPTTTIDAVKVDTPTKDVGPVITLNHVVEPEAPVGPRTEPARPPAPAVITSPQWVSRPSGDQMARNYPDRALTDGVSGVASLRCSVRVDGSLTGCSVAAETPSGRGFGRAGVALSRYFRMSPRTVDGQAVDGAAVSFNIRFNASN